MASMKPTLRYSVLLKKITPKFVFWLVFMLLFIVWIIIQFSQLGRFKHLDGDYAQHSSALLEWRTDGRIPLVGMGSSPLLINLSPLYYWLIYPFYLITNGSIFYNHLACFVYTWVIFLALGLVIYKRPAYRWSFLLLIALFCFNPLILYDRTYRIWNPSYVWQPIVLAWYCLLFASQSKHRVLFSIVGGMACVASISFNLLMAPVVICLLIVSIFRLRRQVLPWLIGMAVAFLVCWSTVLITQFEAIFQNQIVRQNQTFDPLITRLHTLLTMASTDDRAYTNYDHVIIYAAILALIIFCLKRNSNKKLLEEDWFQLLFILIISTIITVAPKIIMWGWYANSLIVIIIILLIGLPSRLKYLIASLIIGYWLAMFLSSLNWPYRVNALSVESCFKQVCQHVSSNQYYYVLYTDVVLDNAPAYFLSAAACPPARLYDQASSGSFEVSAIDPSFPLLVFHDLDVMENEWMRWSMEDADPPFYAEIKPTFDKIYTHPVVSVDCEGDWGWTLYSNPLAKASQLL